jgi:glycosyltransferase involved in cell wall biosynthesis
MKDQTFRQHIVIYLNELVDHFGPGNQVVLLARELVRLGVNVEVVIEAPVDDRNQYLQALRSAGIATHVPSKQVALLETTSWSNYVLLALLLPVRFPLALVDWLVRRQGFHRSWSAVAGRINRYLPAVRWIQPARMALMRKLSAIHQASPIDVLHSFTGRGSVFEWTTKAGVPTIYNENIVPSGRFQVDWWSDMMAARDDIGLVVSVCDAAIPAIRSYLGYEGPVRSIPCMMADPQSNGARADRSGQLLPGRNAQTVFGMAARLSAEKGHRILLEAAAILRNRHGELPFGFWIAGSGPERDELTQMCADLSLDPFVRFLGHLNYDQMRAFWQEIDVLLVSSHWEGMPNVVLEAMANAKPVIATDVGGISEAVDHGVTGWIVPPGDPVELASAIWRIGGDANLQRSMGSAGRARYESCFRPEVVVADHLQAYRDVQPHE